MIWHFNNSFAPMLRVRIKVRVKVKKKKEREREPVEKEVPDTTLCFRNTVGLLSRFPQCLLVFIRTDKLRFTPSPYPPFLLLCPPLC